jgi:4-amino-4-deoxy-L-arabinose transferase-like glycosyltransferase
VLIPGLCFAAGFLAGGFERLIKPGVYLGYALAEVRYGEGGGFTIGQVDTVPGWAFYIKTLTTGLGIVLLVLAIGGTFYLVWRAVARRDRQTVVLLAFPLLYYLFMGASRHYFARYALPLVPFAALLAAELVVAIMTFPCSTASGIRRGGHSTVPSIRTCN